MATIRKRRNLWQVQIRRRNAPHISKSFKLKSDAQAWGRLMEIEADRRTLRHDPRTLESLRLSQLVTRYRDTISIRKKGHNVEKYILNAFLRHPLAKRSIASLTPQDFAAYRDDRLETVSGSGLNRELGILQHVFDVARKEWAYPINENPMEILRKPPNNPPRERRLAAGEYEALLQASSKCRNKLIQPIIRLAVETAMRRGEIIGIRKRDVDFERMTLTIPTTKTAVPRTIPLSPTATHILRPLCDASDTNDRIFPITPNAFRLAWERVLERSGIRNLHFHDLRHEAVSRLFERGYGVAHVAAISGHRDFRMLARYTHVQVNNAEAFKGNI